MEGKVKEVTRRRGRRGKQLLDDVKGNGRVLEIERGSTKSHSVETDYEMNKYRIWSGGNYYIVIHFCALRS